MRNQRNPSLPLPQASKSFGRRLTAAAKEGEAIGAERAAARTETRRVCGDTTYWLRALGADLWHVTADGVSICAPKHHAAALADFEAVTA